MAERPTESSDDTTLSSLGSKQADANGQDPEVVSDQRLVFSGLVFNWTISLVRGHPFAACGD
jgi:hypothetical protein